MGKLKKHKRDRRANQTRSLMSRFKSDNICVNCGEPGRHFLPPSLGEEGRFVCEKKPELEKDI